MNLMMYFRIVVGMGIGVASMSVPVYMSETSPESIRGFLGATFQVSSAVRLCPIMSKALFS